jgi:hypothetical protein
MIVPTAKATMFLSLSIGPQQFDDTTVVVTVAP